jgi:hypothetical protein
MKRLVKSKKRAAGSRERKTRDVEIAPTTRGKFFEDLEKATQRPNGK